MHVSTWPAEPTYRLLFDSLPGNYLVLSPQLLISAASNGFISLVGVTREALLNQPVEVLYAGEPAEVIAEQMAEWQKSVEYVQTLRLSYTLSAQNPPIFQNNLTPRYLQRINNPVFDETGELAYIIHEVKDITAEHLANENARHSQDLFKMLSLATNDAIWDWNLRDNTVKWNEGYRTLFGFPDPEPTLNSWHDYIHEEDRDRVVAGIHAVVNSNHRFWSDEYRFRCADGSYSEVIDRGYLLYDATGAHRMVGSMQDITLYKKAQQQLNESADFFHFLADTVPAFIWTSNPDGTTDYRNHYYYDFVGLENTRKPDFNWTNPVHPDDRDNSLKQWLYAVKTGQPFEVEHRLQAKTGEYRWILSRARPMRNQQGEIIKWFGTSIDIHEHKQYQQQLVDSTQRFQFLAATVPQLIWTTLPNGFHDYFNSRWTEYTGYSLEESQGTEIWNNLLHPDDQDRSRETWEHCLKTGDDYQIEYRFKRASDGAWRWFLARAKPMYNEHNQIIRWFGTCTDIHEQKLAQESLQETNVELKRINEDLDRFVYTASHDLKLPIINMGSLFDEIMSSSQFNDPEHNKLVQMFHKSLDQIHATITDLSEITKVQKNINAERVKVNLPQLTDEICLSIQDVIQNSSARIISDFAALPSIEFSKANLRSILYNLISNALKYRSPHRTPDIYISTALTSDYYVLTVKDNGLGINLERHRDKLFQMFKRFHSHVPGTGLGLYMINRIMQNNNGHIEVESTLDAGSTFRIYFRKY
jgi:PAS domain S-box-containing protein